MGEEDGGRRALIARAAARHQPEHRGRIVECEDCGCDLWRPVKRGGVRRLCLVCGASRAVSDHFLAFDDLELAEDVVPSDDGSRSSVGLAALVDSSRSYWASAEYKREWVAAKSRR